jgi:polysaccharide biosynthesis transport protein
MEERSFHPLDYVSVARRRKWWFVVPLVVCLAIGAAAAVLLPRQYKSEASIGVAAPSLSPDLLKGLSSLDAVERQRSVSQHLLSTTVLERVMREEQMFPDAKAEDVASWLRKRVTINVDTPIGVSPRAGDRGFDSFKLGFVDKDPVRTQRVANRLATIFVEENSKFTTKRAENTTDVLHQQLQASQKKLTAIEQQLAQKKQANMGRLPDQIDANIQMVNGLRQQLESISMQLNGEMNQLNMVETQLQQMRQGVGGSAPMPTATSAALQAAQTRITQLQQQLAQARANGWTDKHPEVISLQGEIAQAKTEVIALRKESASGVSQDALMQDPIYRQKLGERDAAKARINTLRVAEAQARGQIARYQGAVSAAPMVEQDLMPVVREYELEKKNYGDLKAKYDTALLQGDIARQQGGERFSVLYAAGRPVLVSVAPLRVLIMALVAGVVLGAGLVFGREFLDRSIYDARALQNEFEIPVLGEIPKIHGAA